MTTSVTIAPRPSRSNVLLVVAVAFALASGFAGGWFTRGDGRVRAETAPHLWVHSVQFRRAEAGKQRITIGYEASGVASGTLAMEVFAYPGGGGPISTVRRGVAQGRMMESIELEIPPWRAGPAFARLVVFEGDRRTYTSDSMKFNFDPDEVDGRPN